jgi:hypothetical protein
MSDKVCIKFFKQFEYNELVFEAGKVYRLKKTKDDFVGRWIRRGCEVVEDSEKAIDDPRFPIEEKKVEKKSKKKIKKKEKNPEKKIEEIVESEIEKLDIEKEIEKEIEKLAFEDKE